MESSFNYVRKMLRLWSNNNNFWLLADQPSNVDNLFLSHSLVIENHRLKKYLMLLITILIQFYMATRYMRKRSFLIGRH